MKIIDVIKILNDTYDDFYLEYKPSLLYPSSELCFNNGYCYEYHRMLKIFYPKAILVMQNDRMHCATLIDDEIYDVNGKRDDYFNFHEVTGADIEYIYKYYGFFSDWESCRSPLSRFRPRQMCGRGCPTGKCGLCSWRRSPRWCSCWR